MVAIENLSRRFDPIASGWGGVVASIGLIASTGHSWRTHLVFVAVSFGLGALLAGLRSAMNRPSHALMAAALGLALHLVFVALTRALNTVGGPAAAQVAPDGFIGWLKLAGWGAAWALVLGLLIDSLFGRSRRRAR